jgi:PAS domain S-box-containing protein
MLLKNINKVEIKRTMSVNQGNRNKETRASLELLYHISREIATTIDLPTLIERILSLSIQNIGAQNGSILVVDEGGNPVTSALIINGKLVQTSIEEMRITLDEGLAGWVLRHRRAALIPDTSKDERWLQRPDDAEGATGAKSVISVPFLARDQAVGVITLVQSRTDFFQTGHQALIQAIADQSAIAVLNARFHTDTLRKARVMTALAESAMAITASLDSGEVLQRILDQISQAFDTQAVSLAMLEKDKKTLTYCASTSDAEHSPVGLQLEMGNGIAGWVAEHQQGIVIRNAYEDERFYQDFDEKTGFKTCAVACVPMFSEGEIIGVLEAINPVQGRFDPDALQVLQGISSLAGTAIRHARLFEDLQEAHKRYYDLFEDSITSILLTDWSGKILEANQQTTFLSHYSKEELAGMFIDSLQKADRESLGDHFEALRIGKTISYETALQTKANTEIPVTVNVQAVLLRGKSYLQWVLRDDTKRKELDKMREDLLSMIYHDLRSPLANVMSSLDVLASMVVFKEEAPAIQSLFNIAIRSTKRIQRLTASLLDINRLEAGNPVVGKAPTPIRRVIWDSLAEVKPVVESKKIATTVAIAEELPELMVNEEMIQRVVINLLENAIKYTPCEGSIQIGAQVGNEEVQVWVKDTGPGIPKDQLQIIFEKFIRLQGKVGWQGYGLGLAFCRLAVEGHRGRIWAENNADGGSCFTFSIPIAGEASEQEKAGLAPE